MTRQEVEEKIKNGESLNEVDLSGLDLSGAQLEGANLEEGNLEAADLSGSNLSHANLINANLARANLNGAILISSTLEGSNLRNTSLAHADISHAQFCEAYMGGASLVKVTARETSFQGCYLGGANLSEAQLLDANLECADLEKTDLRNSHMQKCQLDGANLRAAKVAGATFNGIIGDGIGSQEVDFSLEGDGSKIRTFSAEELEKMTAPLAPAEGAASSEPTPLSLEPAEKPVAPTAEPETEPAPSAPPVETTSQETPVEIPIQKDQVPFEKRNIGPPRTPEIKLFIGKTISEEGMSGLALYLIKVRELFEDINLTLKEFSNKMGVSLLTFTTDSDANLFVSVFLLLHFFKFSYEVELKELYTQLKETCCIQPGEMEEIPVLDFWSLLPKFIKFPQAAFGFADLKKEDLKNLEIILSTGQSINTFFHQGQLRIDYETVPYNYPFTINIKDQLLYPIPHQKGAELTKLFGNLHIAVGTEESITSYDREIACFTLSRFINEISKNSSSPTILSPAACNYWSRFWAQIRTHSSIAGAARSICEYFPSLEILMT
jgi:hypothetical protein